MHNIAYAKKLTRSHAA